MPNPGWNVHWSSELSGSDSNLFATSGWRPWRTDTSSVYITPSPLFSGTCIIYIEDAPSGYDTVIAGGYTHGLPINPSSQFNGDSSYRNRWTAVMDFYPTERPVPHDDEDDAHAGVFIRVQPNRTWAGHPNQTRFGCFINGLSQTDQGVLQFTGDRIGDSGEMERKLSPFDLSEDPFSNPNQKCRLQIIEEEKLVSGSWKLQWGAEVWNLSATPDDKIGELKWVTADDLSAANVAVPALSGSRFAMGLGPAPATNADGTVTVDHVATSYWYF